jgi:UDP-N-acetyl-D-glucosamine dehydrogenase
MQSLLSLRHASQAHPAGSWELERRIQNRRAVVGVVGQGYVGFPLAQQCAKAGFKTLGFDINGDTTARCERENRSRNYSAVMTALSLRTADVIIVAVPTPTRKSGETWAPDLSRVIEAIHTLKDHVLGAHGPQLLVMESTYAPGTTRNVVAPIVAERFAVGTQVLLGYSPERIDPGNTRFNLQNTAKVTSGMDQDSARLVQLFYSRILDRAVPATSLEAAEATKILENTFRFVNITFAQEFDTYCERIGIDTREITNLASTKPFGYMPFYAGPGIGGHCIAEDPYFLYQSMLDAGLQPKLLNAAIDNHESRAGVIVERIVRQLGGRPIDGARILVLGVSYKPNIGDARRSPAQPIIALLEADGAEVDYHDAFVPRFAGRTGIDAVALWPDDYDLAVLVTAHSYLDYRAMIAAGWKLFDATNTLWLDARRAGPSGRAAKGSKGASERREPALVGVH